MFALRADGDGIERCSVVGVQAHMFVEHFEGGFELVQLLVEVANLHPIHLDEWPLGSGRCK